MIKIYFKILLLLILVIPINLIIKEFAISNHTWIIPRLSAKENYLDKNCSRINCLFFGSSRIDRNLNPLTFDKEVKENELIKSFNLAIIGLKNPQIYFFYEKFLEKYKNKTKYFFIELHGYDLVSSQNLHTGRMIYWYDFNYYVFALKSIIASEYSLKFKLIGIKNHTLSYIENLFNFQFASEFLKQSNRKLPSKCLGKNNNGFYPADLEMLDNDLDGKVEKINFENFQRDSSNLSLLRNINTLYNTSEIKESKYNKVHLDKINSLIVKSKEYGIHLIFILPPRMEEFELKELFSIYNKIPVSNKINLSNPSQYPELYKANYSFDHGHLNSSGAELFSKYLAREFIKIKK